MEDAREHLTVLEPGKEGRRTFTADGNKVLLFHVRNDILNQTHCLKFQTHKKKLQLEGWVIKICIISTKQAFIYSCRLLSESLF